MTPSTGLATANTCLFLEAVAADAPICRFSTFQMACSRLRGFAVSGKLVIGLRKPSWQRRGNHHFGIAVLLVHSCEQLKAFSCSSLPIEVGVIHHLEPNSRILWRPLFDIASGLVFAQQRVATFRFFISAIRRNLSRTHISRFLISTNSGWLDRFRTVSPAWFPGELMPVSARRNAPTEVSKTYGRFGLHLAPACTDL